MSHLRDYNFNPPKFKRNPSAEALLIAQQEKQRNVEQLAKKIYDLEQAKYIRELIVQDKLFTALKYIKTNYPEFKERYPTVYKWLKKAEKNNLNEDNVENLTVININKFTVPYGNALENVNVYETFATKKGGKTYRKKRHHSRRRHTRRN